MHLKQAVRRFLEVEGEGTQRLRGAQPGELALAPAQVRLEVGGVALAQRAVHAVAADDQIRLGERLDWQLLLKGELDPQHFTPVLEQLQQLFAGEAAESVARRDGALPSQGGLNVVTVGEA